MLPTFLTRIPEPVRAWLYRVVAASFVLAALYGWMTEGEAFAWLGWVTVVLGLPASVVASANTSTKGRQ